MLRITIGLLTATLFAACAGYSIERNGTGDGYDVYAPYPYLAGSTSVKDGATSVTYSIVYLPDMSRRYRVRSWAGLGKADFTFTFADGWKLTGVTDKSDNTSVAESITKLVSLAQGLIPKGLGGAADAAAGAGPVLYRIEFDDCGKVCGLTKVDASHHVACPPNQASTADCCVDR